MKNAIKPALYSELVAWYHLLDSAQDHLEEAESYRATLEQALPASARTLLELGAGAGNNAFHLKQRFQCSLSDISEPMLELSRRANPECEHLLGDMRTLRLARTFDAVLVHDAVMYMTSEADLKLAVETAYVHTRPGGAALFAPDFVTESFHAGTELHSGEDGERALRCLEWCFDPDPSDTSYVVHYAFLLRDQSDVRGVHDCHIEGLFPRAVWFRTLEAAGYRVELVARNLGDGESDTIFCCKKP